MRSLTVTYCTYFYFLSVSLSDEVNEHCADRNMPTISCYHTLSLKRTLAFIFVDTIQKRRATG